MSIRECVVCGCTHMSDEINEYQKEITQLRQQCAELESENEKLHEATGYVLECETLNEAKARLIVSLPEGKE